MDDSIEEMDDSIEIHAPEKGIPVPPAKRRDDRSSKTKKRAESATSSKATEAESADRPSRSRDKKKTLSSSISVVGRSRSDGGPVPLRTNGSERHRSHSGDRGRRGHGSERRHDSSRSRHSPRRWRSGKRTRPTSSWGSSSRTRHADLTDAPGSGRASGRPTEVRPSSSATCHQRHHSRSSADCRSRSRSQHHDRRESVDSVRSGSSYVSRREVQLSPVAPQQTEKRTITVIHSPPRPAETDDSQGVTGPEDSAALADSAGVTGPMDSAEAQDSAGYEPISARKWRSRRLCTTQQLLPTWHRIRTRQVPTQHAHRNQQVTTRHTHRTQQVTTRQGVMGRQPRVLQQGQRQLQDKTLPWFLMSTVWYFRFFWEKSTRQP